MNRKKVAGNDGQPPRLVMADPLVRLPSVNHEQTHTRWISVNPQ